MTYDSSIPIWTDSIRPEYVRRRRIHTVNFGPETITGPPQSITSDAGRWGLGYREIAIYGDRLLAVRAILTRISQRKPIYVTPFDGLRSPRTRAGSPIADGTTFGAQPVDFTVVGNKAARSTSLTIAKASTYSLLAGHFIGLGDHLHTIETIVASADANPAHYDVTIWPMLREAITAADPVYSEIPIVRVVATKETLEVDEALDQIDRVGKIDIEFEEARWT